MTLSDTKLRMLAQYMRELKNHLEQGVPMRQTTIKAVDAIADNYDL